MTPIRRQYLKIKSSYPDSIVLFRLGDFYETFDEDAGVVSRELEITLTSRTMGKGLRVPMAGVPAHSVDSYLARLVRKGYQVAICEQLSDPALAKGGLVERDVVRVVTPGTVFEDSLLDQKANNYLAAVALRGPQAGLAYVDITTGEFAATELPAAQLPLELARVGPAETLLPRSISPASIVQSAAAAAPPPPDAHKPGEPDGEPGQSDGESGPPGGWAERGEWGFTPADDALFEPAAARQALLAHYRILTLESFGCEDWPLAVSAAGAILGYLGHTQKSARVRLQNLAAYSTRKFMALDERTRHNLELFQGGRQQQRQFSLLAAIDRTRTPMGGRLLRRWLGQPLLELAELEQRLAAVAGFYNDGVTRRQAADLLGRIADLERILGRIAAGGALPRELLALKTGLAAIPELRQMTAALTPNRPPPPTTGPTGDAAADELPGDMETPAAGLSGDMETPGDGFSGDMETPPAGPPGDTAPPAVAGAGLAALGAALTPVPEVVELLAAALADEPAGAPGEGGVLRPGFSPEIDQLKAASVDARQYIAGLEQQERERTGVRGLKVGYNQVFGYYIEVGKSQTAALPADYIRRQTLTNAERYIIPELKEYESVVLNARERLAEAESAAYRRICAQVGESAAAISRAAAAIAALDVFCGLAQAAADNGYVRPTLNAGPEIRIRDGRHPVVERSLPAGQYVPNDVSLSSDDARVVVLTGPNMAGKSTYIRQAALITLLAQIGSFVPAAEAAIGLVDRIFTRVGLQDDLATGQSTFMVEMVETAAILNQATPRSLVILDEIGRGTSTYDGLSIARAVIEHLHNHPRLGCKTLFATHYHELTQLADILPGVRNYCVAVAEEDGEVVFLHRIIPGGADKSYGVHVARLAGLPAGVVNRAWEVLAELESAGRGGGVDPARRAAPPAQQMPLFNAGPELADRLRRIDVATLTPLEALNRLYELQEQARQML